MADMRNASTLQTTVLERRLVTRSRAQRLIDGITGPSVVRLGTVGDVPAAHQVAGRVECRRRLT